MQKPLILVTMSTEEDKIFTYHAYIEAITRAGGVPICAPYCEADRLSALVDGLLMTGGMDIEPERYGETAVNDTVKTTPERDGYEWALLDSFYSSGKPIIGICRGFQVLSTYLGGTMYQDLPSQLDRHTHGEGYHTVTAQPSWWQEQFGEHFTINTLHHQAVKTLGKGLVATVYADDGTLEAFESDGKRVQACQWHPEKLLDATADCPSMLPFFEQFIKNCKC